MEKILTAEEFLQNHYQISHFYDDKTNQMLCFSSDMQKAMVEFAKLHVEAALKAASSTAFSDSKYNVENSYPLENIK